MSPRISMLRRHADCALHNIQLAQLVTGLTTEKFILIQPQFVVYGAEMHWHINSVPVTYKIVI